MPRPRTIAEIRADHERRERAAVLASLERHGWRLTRAAEELGVRISTLQAMIARHGLGDLYAQHSPGPGRPRSG